MKNVYDILVNFKKNAYEFYEWQKNDGIEHIKVIPSFKVSNKCLLDVLRNNVSVEESFLNKIKERTEIFSNHLIKVIGYACIIFNEDTSLALEFDEKGNVIGKSKLLFDESDDVIKEGEILDITNIKYSILSPSNYKDKYTRKESNLILMLTRYLDNCYLKERKDEIKYMYLECFNDNIDDYDKAYNSLKEKVSNLDLDVIDKLKTLIKVVKR